MRGRRLDVARKRGRLRTIVAYAAGGIAALALGAFLFAWSGLYNVAASAGHWGIVEYALAFVMQNSVETHAMAIDAPPLDDDDRIVLGAGAYHSGCAWCHGAPGIPRNPVTRSMLPAPPDLSTDMREWKDEELFWIVKHGIKYTGMPAWVSQRRDDEVWAVVAFLRHIESTDAATYRALALGFAETSESGREIATEEGRRRGGGRLRTLSWSGRPWTAQCARPGAAWPARRCADRSAARLCGREARKRRHAAARERSHTGGYRAGRGLLRAPPRPPREASDPGDADLDNGRAIFEQGDAANGIPACLTCHGDDALQSYPRLAGQSRRYVETQLRLWKTETTRHTEAAAIMAPIARALSDGQIRDVAAYLEACRLCAPAARNDASSALHGGFRASALQLPVACNRRSIRKGRAPAEIATLGWLLFADRRDRPARGRG